MTKPVHRKVREFPFYSTRLQEINYQAIIAEGREWTDNTFRPITSSIIDETMSRDSRIQSWSTLAWKRPKDVYGEGNFCIYKKIGPEDI